MKLGESHRRNWICVFLLLMLQSLWGRGYHTKIEFQKYFFISWENDPCDLQVIWIISIKRNPCLLQIHVSSWKSLPESCLSWHWISCRTHPVAVVLSLLTYNTYWVVPCSNSLIICTALWMFPHIIYWFLCDPETKNGKLISLEDPERAPASDPFADPNFFNLRYFWIGSNTLHIVQTILVYIFSYMIFTYRCIMWEMASIKH